MDLHGQKCCHSCITLSSHFCLPLRALHWNPGGFSWHQPSTKMNMTSSNLNRAQGIKELRQATLELSPRPTSPLHYTSQHGFHRVENDLRISLTWHRTLIIYLHQQLPIFTMTWGCTGQRFCCQKFCNAPEILNHCWTPTWMEWNKIVLFTLWHLRYHRMSSEEKHSAKKHGFNKNLCQKYNFIQQRLLKKVKL